MSDECIFCHHDPYHYVDIGVGFQAAAVNCCDLGVALYQHGDEDLAKVANRIEALEETLKLRTTERNHANDIVDTYVDQVKALEAKLEKAVSASVDTAASLAAAISLLEKGSKKAAPSNKMFDQMMADYRSSLERTRTTLAAVSETHKLKGEQL